MSKTPPGSDTPEQPTDADPWWGALEGEGSPPVTPSLREVARVGGSASPIARLGSLAKWPAGTAAAAATAKAKAPRSGTSRRHTPPTWMARLRQRVRRSERLHRLTVRTAVLLAVVAVLSCAVGVIMLNNLVIRRSAELGRLENQRRTLRTENAMMAADIAKLSAPPRVAHLARKRLGMQPGEQMATFIYLDPANRPVPIAPRSPQDTQGSATPRAKGTSDGR